MRTPSGCTPSHRDPFGINLLVRVRSMRILHVIPSLAPRYGGPSAALTPMCEALARVPGVSIEIATTDADGVAGRLTYASLPASAVPIFLFRRDFSERWKFSAGLWRWL